MTNYILRRLFQTILVIFFVSFLCFYLMALMPGDPVDMLAASNPDITTEDMVRLRQLYGLDQPVYKRYGNWIGSFLTGDMGYSRTYKIPVTEILAPRLLNTFILSGASLLLSLLIAIPLGILAALKNGSKLDYLVNLFAFGGISIPSFWLAIMLILIFAVQIPLFPAGGTFSITDGDASFFASFIDRLQHLVLPVISLAILQIGRFVRFTRSAMLESMRQDYIRTARAKGLKQTVIIVRHGLRNALLPLITIVAISISYIFSGAVLTETVFSYQGVGKLIYDSILSNDFNVAMVSVVLSVFMVLVMSLIADILYAFADPRISYQ